MIASALTIPAGDVLTAWGVVLDPSEVATNRTELNINSDTITIDQTGIDWGDAAIQEFLADMEVGSSAVDYRLPNRTVTITLSVGRYDADETAYLAAKAALQQKVALFQREGGWLKRDTGVPLYADVVNATLTFPDHWGPTGFIENDVKLVLECLPDFYAAEVTLDLMTGTGQVVGVLAQGGVPAVIGGDHPSRVRIIVTDTSGQAQKGLIWAFRSRYYDSASTAALAYNAAAMTPVNTAAIAAVSGSYTGNVIAVSPQASTWHPFLVTDLLSGGQLTHVGSYKVWARCTTDLAGMLLRMAWSLDDTTTPVFNDQVALPLAGYGTTYSLVSLGTIRVDKPPVGAHWWRGIIQAYAAVGSQHVAIDEVWLQPLDESAGEASASDAPPSFALSPSSTPTAAANDATVGTVAWSNPTNVFAEDSSYASVSLASGVQSEYLTTTGYGFAIPAGATITGIVVQVAYRIVPSGVAVLTPSLMKAGAVQAGAPASYMPETFAGDNVAIYGGADDLWGLAWTVSDINNAGFGASVIMTNIDVPPVTPSFQVNNVVVRVFYTTGGGFTVAQDAVINASRVAEVRTEGVFREDTASTAYVPVGGNLGDLPRVPPSGMEGRGVELFAKPSRGDLSSLPDAGIDGLTAQVICRPSYLFPA